MKIRYLPLGGLETNCYLVSDEQTNACAIIDPGDAGAMIAAAVRTHGLSPRFVLLTHAHYDHVGGLGELLREFPVPVYLSREEAAAPDQFAGGLQHVTDWYSEGDTVTMDGVAFRVLLTPGHTRGSVCLLAEGALFSGDTLFAGACGRTDFSGGSMEDMMRSLRRLAGLPDETLVLPGHGMSSTIGEEKASNPYMQEAMGA